VLTRRARAIPRGSRTASCLAVLCLAIAALGGCGSASEGGPDSTEVEKLIWGPTRLPDGRSAFPTYDQLGVDFFQIQLRWPDAAPTRPASPEDPADPAYRWPAELGYAISQAKAHGIEVAVLVTRSPSWANGGRGPLWAPRPADFAQFLTAASRRYPEIRRWMIWGEPNRVDRFLPNAPGSPLAPRRYASLLDAAYGALKAVSPDNVVIGGMTFTGGDVKPPQFIQWMRLPSGQPPRIDWYGHNPYPFRFPRISKAPHPGGWRDVSDLDTLADEVNRASRSGGQRPRLWLSEFTVQSDHTSRVFKAYVSRQSQARWLTAGYAAAEQVAQVEGLGWFTLLDQAGGALAGHWGLLTSDGRIEKPAFHAYQAVRD
jgi:hypothetical protein